jgi:hypothetical protein
MALNDAGFSTKLQGIFDQMWEAASTDEPKSDKWFADQLAAAFDAQMKTATVAAGISVSVQGTATAQQGFTTGVGTIS